MRLWQPTEIGCGLFDVVVPVRLQGTWFGPEGAALLGVWHLPDDDLARGAVVLCPPLGKEAVHAYRTMALAAQLLAQQGVAALRFDYRGTGDSTGDELAPDAVARWRADVAIAVAYARSVVPAGVALAGLRAGALIAGTAAADCGPLTALALWDPVVKGRTYLREQSVLYRLKVSVDEAQTDAVELVGAALHPDAASALKGLSLRDTAPVDRHTPLLLAARSERADDAVLTTLAAGFHADRLVVLGHERVFDVATFEVELPAASTAAVAQWLAQRFPVQTQRVSLDARLSTIVGQDASGPTVRERLVRIGSNKLFAVVTEPYGQRGGDSEPPFAVTLASSTEHRIGTGRLWVDLARRLAREGVSCIRYDRRGTGDSGVVIATEHTGAYSPTMHEDLDDVLDGFGLTPQRTSLVGHCSGAWLAGEAAAEGRACAVVLIGAARFNVGRQREVMRLVDDPDRADHALTSRSGRAKIAIKPLIPGPAWRWLGRRGLAQVPEVVLKRLCAAGVATTLVLAPVDYRHFVANRGERALNRLRRGGWFAVVHVGEAGDHGLVHRGLRVSSIDHAVAAVSHQYGLDHRLSSAPEIGTADQQAAAQGGSGDPAERHDAKNGNRRIGEQTG